MGNITSKPSSTNSGISKKTSLRRWLRDKFKVCAMNRIMEIFEDRTLVGKIRRKLPYLFQLAELESSRAGKLGMEVGSLRERVLIALLIYKFGANSVETKIPITEPEVDVRLFGEPISIKTMTGTGGFKVIWTVDAQKSKEFLEAYYPKYDIILAQIIWGETGKLCYFPVGVQRRILEAVGRESYLKLPKANTNPRGVEISKEALGKIIASKDTKSIEIIWQRPKEIEFDPYQRWVDLWKEE